VYLASCENSSTRPDVCVMTQHHGASLPGEVTLLKWNLTYVRMGYDRASHRDGCVRADLHAFAQINEGVSTDVHVIVHHQVGKRPSSVVHYEPWQNATSSAYASTEVCQAPLERTLVEAGDQIDDGLKPKQAVGKEHSSSPRECTHGSASHCHDPSHQPGSTLSSAASTSST